jgi:hypothetical protein
MSRRKFFILGGLSPVLSLAVLGVLFFAKPGLLSELPFIGAFGKVADAQQSVDQSQVENANIEEKPAHNGAENEEPSEPPMTSSDKQIEVVAAADFSRPQSQVSAIVQAQRTISAMQMGMAQGKTDSSRALKAAMIAAQRLLSDTNTSKITDGDLEAIALYVLSGGDPSIAAKFSKSAAITAHHKALLQGVVSFATADFTKAKEELLPLDGKQFNTVLDAQLSMVQVQLEAYEQSEKSLKRLSYVADIVPGTLIEEAAIRRMIPVFAKLDDPSGFAYWTKRYLRRFTQSFYYLDFETSLINTFVRRAERKFPSDEVVLAGIFETAGEARAGRISSQILLRAVENADTDRCDQIEQSISRSFDVKSSSFLNTRAVLKVCKAADGNKDRLFELNSIDVSQLDEGIKKVVADAIVMATEIQIDAPLKDDGSFGPYFPISETEEYGSLSASVAQQLDGSVRAIKKAGDDEVSPDNSN